MNQINRLILVKHSLPEIIESIPARDWDLSEEGRIRAQMLAGKLNPYRPIVIFSSIEPKAQQTAEIIGEKLGLDFQVLDGLHEHDRSQSPFYSRDEFQSLIQEFFEKPDMLVIGSESANQAFARIHTSINSILKSQNGENIMVVSHGTVISLFISRLTGHNNYLLWKELGLPSYAVLDVKSNTLLKMENLD
jgi:broad specificity phosphatase PhoE